MTAAERAQARGARKPSITRRAIDLLDSMAFACEVGVSLASPEKASGQAHSEREALEPSFRRYAEEARALVAEYRHGR